MLEALAMLLLLLLDCLLVLAALFWVVALLNTVREKRRGRWVIKATDALPAPAATPRVSVLIPARNEERNLRACLDSARQLSWPDLEIIVVDDHSTDATGRIAAEAAAADRRVRALSAPDKPDGWMGKSWALHTAAATATGTWLLLVDADVTMHPRALAQSFAWAAQEKARMLSGFGHLVLGSFWEKVVMPVIGGMIIGGNPLDEVNDPEHSRVLANGQFILVERAAYDAIGGHESVRGEIIDDVALARVAKEKKIAYRMVFCRELFRTRMYTSFGEIWRGWTKNVYAGLGYRWWVALVVVAFTAITSLLPPAALVALAIGHAPAHRFALEAAGAGTALLFAYRLYASTLFDQDWRFAWSHPLGAAVTCGIFLESAWRGMTGRHVEWKGRRYGAGGPVSR